MNHNPTCHCFPIMTALLIAFLATNLRLCSAQDDSDPQEATKATELSVAPSTHREFSAQRPAWVDAVPSRHGDVEHWPVTSTPCRSKSLCDEGLKVSMRATVETYIESLTGVEDSSRSVTFDDEWINLHRDKTKTYLGTVKIGNEEMYEAATILLFDGEDRKLIEHQWQRHQVGQRLAVLGALSGSAVTIFVGIAAMLSIVTRRAEQRVAG